MFPNRTKGRGPWSELGGSGMLTLLGLVALVASVIVLVPLLRPPTVEEIERDIWADWARLAVDAQGLTIADAVIDGRRPAAQKLLETLGRLIASEGERFVVRTDVRYLRVRDREGAPFAEWRSRFPEDAGGGWKQLHIDLADPLEGPIGALEVDYRFYGGGLDSLPNIRRLQRLYAIGLATVAILALVTLLAALANWSRIRERAGRLQSQQVTIELARQMCHELRNGLWAFALEGKNLRHLFQLIDDYFRLEPDALAQAATRVGLDPSGRERLAHHRRRALAAERIDPETDILPANSMARRSDDQVQRFTRYIHLTVEELDRELLGADTDWRPAILRLGNAWAEARDLLAPRLAAAGLEVVENSGSGDDWVQGEQRALVHIFVNLIKNAIEAVPPEETRRRVEYSTRRDGDRVHCQIRGFGTPIDPAHLPRLFQHGFTTKTGAGRGTGLSLILASLTRMRGRIRVESNAEAGTAFHLDLPAGQPGPAALAPADSCPTLG